MTNRPETTAASVLVIGSLILGNCAGSVVVENPATQEASATATAEPVIYSKARLDKAGNVPDKARMESTLVDLGNKCANEVNGFVDGTQQVLEFNNNGGINQWQFCSVTDENGVLKTVVLGFSELDSTGNYVIKETKANQDLVKGTRGENTVYGYVENDMSQGVVEFNQSGELVYVYGLNNKLIQIKEDEKNPNEIGFFGPVSVVEGKAPTETPVVEATVEATAAKDPAEEVLKKEMEIGFEASFVGEVRTSDGTKVMDFPVTVQLAKNLTDRVDSPLKEVVFNEKSRYKEGIPMMVMENLYERYKYENPGSSLSYDEFITTKPRLNLAINSENSKWGDPKSLDAKVENIFPNSITIVLTDRLLSAMSKETFFLSESNDGGLLIAYTLVPDYVNQLFTEWTEFGPENIEKGYSVESFLLFGNILWTLYSLDNEKALASGGYVISSDRVRGLYDRDKINARSSLMQYSFEGVDPNGPPNMDLSEMYFHFTR